MTEREKEIRRFIVENFLFGADDGGLGPEESFLEKGIIDSMGVLEIVNFLETRYGITIEDAEITPSNLDSIRKLSNFLDRKITASACK